VCPQLAPCLKRELDQFCQVNEVIIIIIIVIIIIIIIIIIITIIMIIIRIWVIRRADQTNTYSDWQ